MRGRSAAEARQPFERVLSLEPDVVCLQELKCTEEQFPFEAIKAAYRRLAKEHHPDRQNGCKNAEARFKAFGTQVDTLSRIGQMDPDLAASIVVLSTFLSILSIPLVFWMIL